MAQTLWDEVSLRIAMPLWKFFVRIKINSKDFLVSRTQSGPLHGGLFCLSNHGKSKEAHRAGPRWPCPAISLLGQQPGMVEMDSSGALEAGLHWPQPITVICSSSFQYHWLLKQRFKANSMCQSPGHGDWFRGGVISAQHSDWIFNLWMWAKPLKLWLLWEPSSDLERSQQEDKMRNKKR